MNHRKWWVLLAMCLITVMLAIDATALNIAIPVIANEFYASLTDMQWVINAFFLLAAMIQIFGGHLGDSYGHKRIFLINVVLFILSSAGAGFSTNEDRLIFFRALQGASVGITSPLSIVLIFEAFPKEEQSYARSFVVATMGIALAAGAPLGGLFVHTIGWRWIFFINIPIGLVCYFLTSYFCHEKKPTNKRSIDPWAVFFLIFSLFCIAFALNQVQNWGFLSLAFLGLLAGGSLSLFFLYKKEKNQGNPMVDFSFFKMNRFFINSMLRIIVQIIFLGILFFLPLYLQNVSGETAVVSGLTMLALTLVMGIVSPFAGKWVDFEDEKRANITSMFLLLTASFIFLFLKTPPNFTLLSIGLILFGVAIAIMYVSTTTGALASVPESKLGAVSGLFFTIVWLSCALGVSFSGTSIAEASQSSLERQLNEQGIELSQDEYAHVERVARGLSPMSSLDLTIPSIKNTTATAFTAGIRANAWVFFILSGLGLILSLFLRLSPKKPKNQLEGYQ